MPRNKTKSERSIGGKGAWIEVADREWSQCVGFIPRLRNSGSRITKGLSTALPRFIWTLESLILSLVAGPASS